MGNTTLNCSISHGASNVVCIGITSLNSFRSARSRKILRIVPEHDSNVVLYSSSEGGAERYYTQRIVCWALRESGQVVAIVPWLSRLVASDEIDDPEMGRPLGFYNLNSRRLLYEPPAHKVAELDAVNTFDDYLLDDRVAAGFIPDNTGVGVLLNIGGDRHTALCRVIGWKLDSGGQIHALVELEGNRVLVPIGASVAGAGLRVSCFIDRNLVVGLRAKDPDALLAVDLLLEKAAESRPPASAVSLIYS